MAGGSGVEYYFGYKLPQNDHICEDWRSRDLSWDYCSLALNLFKEQKFPLGDMLSADELIGNPQHTTEAYCFAKPDELYLVYLPNGGKRDIKLPKDFTVKWFNPREGGLTDGGAAKSGTTTLSAPDSQNDWLAIIRQAPHASIHVCHDRSTLAQLNHRLSPMIVSCLQRASAES
jgi:hypothetical protein